MVMQFQIMVHPRTASVGHRAAICKPGVAQRYQWDVEDFRLVPLRLPPALARLLRGLGNIGTALPRQPTDSVLRFAEKIMINTLVLRDFLGFLSDRTLVSMGFPVVVPGVGATGCSPVWFFSCTTFRVFLSFLQWVTFYSC